MKFKALLCLAASTMLLACAPLLKGPEMAAGSQAEARQPVRYESYYHYILGYEAERTGRWEDALEHYKLVLKYDPGDPYIRTQIALVHLKKGEMQKAIDLMEEVVGEYPEYVPALIALGQIYNSRQMNAEAIGIFRKVLRLDPEQFNVYLHLGLLLNAEGRMDEAKQVLVDLLDLDPANSSAAYFLGLMDMDTSDFDEAAKYFARAIDLNPDLDAAHINLGLIMESRGDFDEAERHYKAAYEINPHSTLAMERLGQLYVKMKAVGSAIEQYSMISERDPSNADVHQKLALLYLEEEDYSNAVEEFRLVLEARPEDTAARFFMAVALEELKRYDDAIVEMNTIINQQPDHLRAYLHLGYLYSMQGRLEESAAAYREILAFEKEKPEIYALLSRAYIDLNDYESAVKTLMDGLQKFPGDEELNFSMALVYEKTGTFQDVERYLRKVLEANPDNADALNYLGYSLAEKGIRLDEALPMIQRAVELKPGNGYVLDSMAWVYFKLGRLDEALEFILKALKEVDDDPVILEHLGDIYLKRGSKDKAKEAWLKALEYHQNEEGLKERVEGKLNELGLPAPALPEAR